MNEREKFDWLWVGQQIYNLLLRNLKRFIFSMEEATHKSTINFSFFINSERKVSFLICFSELKMYYNSISRQSGIVHKDKAMRQLDLDLWEMNWLVAGPRKEKDKLIWFPLFENGRNQSIIISLLWGPLCVLRMEW